MSFLYFGYGSNLCGDRLRMRNGSAKLVEVVRLDGVRIDFTRGGLGFSWRGAVADIVDDDADGSCVYGGLWSLSGEDAASLDAQEGVWQEQAADGSMVDIGAYKRREVKVVGLASGKVYEGARTYEVVEKDLSGLKPSKAYKGVIVCGAMELGLPEDYQRKLQAIETNGYEGDYPSGYGRWLKYGDQNAEEAEEGKERRGEEEGGGVPSSAKMTRFGDADDALEKLDAELALWWKEVESKVGEGVGGAAEDDDDDDDDDELAPPLVPATSSSSSSSVASKDDELIQECMAIVEGQGLGKGEPLWMPTEDLKEKDEKAGTTKNTATLSSLVDKTAAATGAPRHAPGRLLAAEVNWLAYEALRGPVPGAAVGAAVTGAATDAAATAAAPKMGDDGGGGGSASQLSFGAFGAFGAFGEAQRALNTEALSFPVTLVYALEHLVSLSGDGDDGHHHHHHLHHHHRRLRRRSGRGPLRVHVLGAADAECEGAEKWLEVLQLRAPYTAHGIELSFVGPEVPEPLHGMSQELSFEDPEAAQQEHEEAQEEEEQEEHEEEEQEEEAAGRPFLRIGTVHAESPAAAAGLVSGDLIVAFGASLTAATFADIPQSVVPVVKAHVGKPLPMRVLRSEEQQQEQQQQEFAVVDLVLQPQRWQGARVPIVLTSYHEREAHFDARTCLLAFNNSGPPVEILLAPRANPFRSLLPHPDPVFPGKYFHSNGFVACLCGGGDGQSDDEGGRGDGGDSGESGGAPPSKKSRR
eukprot:g1416.t1